MDKNTFEHMTEEEFNKYFIERLDALDSVEPASCGRGTLYVPDLLRRKGFARRFYKRRLRQALVPLHKPILIS